MSPAFAIEHSAMSVLGTVILGAIGVGTWRFGFPHMFNERIGRVVMILGGPLPSESKRNRTTIFGTVWPEADWHLCSDLK